MSLKLLSNIYSILSTFYYKFYCFFGDYRNYNYIEYFSWLSASVLSLFGLLTIFLGVHYQDTILKAKQLLWWLRTEGIELKELINKLLSYEYMVQRGISTYKTCLKLFKKVSIITGALWLLITFVFLTRIETFGGAIIAILGFALLVITLIWVYNLFYEIQSNNEIIPIANILDMSKAAHNFYNKNILGEVIVPSYEFKISKIDNKVYIKLLIPIPVYNYTIALQAKKEDFVLDFTYKSTQVRNIIDFNGNFETYNISDREQNLMILEHMDTSCTFYIYIKENSIERDWRIYEGKIKIEENTGYKEVFVTPLKQVLISIPNNLLDLVKQTHDDKFMIKCDFI